MLIKQNEAEPITKVSYAIMLFLNVLALLLGIVFLMNKSQNLFSNVYGVLMLVVFLGNIRMAYRETLNRAFGDLYLIFSFLIMFALPFINTLVSSLPSIHKTQSILSVVMVFSLHFLGGNLSISNLFGQSKKVENTSNQKERVYKVWTGGWIQKVLLILLVLGLIYGLILAIGLLRIGKSWYSEIFVSEFALFFAIAFLSLGILLHRFLGQEGFRIVKALVRTVTIATFMIFMLPIIFLPILLKGAALEYEAAFGGIKLLNPEEISFRRNTFSLPEYFFGIPSPNYEVQENVMFYEGTEGIDKGIKLYFDVYTPPKNKSGLLGGNSVLIRIHGGAWTMGDKGMFNFAQMNKYFAGQGYVVFDIQYGLSNVERLFDILPASKERVGSFTVDDMVRHIGIFTDYLVKHREEYHADLNSVFISGGSAGGQLALAAGLGITEGGFDDILNDRLKIKGIIPFYPANGLSDVLELGGQKALVNPTILVSENSPPCLIYQGNQDGMVDPSVSEQLQAAYHDNGNFQCAVMRMPFGGHASDLYFSGYYNQVFLYYMERFMYQYG